LDLLIIDKGNAAKVMIEDESMKFDTKQRNHYNFIKGPQSKDQNIGFPGLLISHNFTLNWKLPWL